MLRNLQINGQTFRIYEKGNETPILFVHGFPLDHSMWTHQLAHFSEQYRVIAPDLRGFGGSSVGDAASVSMEEFADDLNGILDALSITEPIVYCGLSMGGYIGWQFLQRFRPRVAAMVLCDTKSAADSTEVARARQMMAQQVVHNGVDEPAKSMIPKLFCQRSRDHQPDRVNETLNIMLQTDRRSVAAAQRGMAARSDATNILSRIDVPSLVLCGTEDVITPADEMRAMAEQISESTFALIPDAGHMAPLENPRVFNSHLEQFLRQL